MLYLKSEISEFQWLLAIKMISFYKFLMNIFMLLLSHSYASALHLQGCTDEKRTHQGPLITLSPKVQNFPSRSHLASLASLLLCLPVNVSFCAFV